MSTNYVKNKQIAEEAASWAIHIDQNKLNSKQKKELATWLKSSPAHVEELLLACSLIFAMGDVDKQKKIDIDSLILQADKNVVSFDNIQTSNPSVEDADGSLVASYKKYLLSAVAVAASVLIMLTVNLVQTTSNHQESEILMTQVGEQRSLTLTDGSTVFLNTDTKIEVIYTPDARKIKLLEGEALFEVTSNAKRPFQVYSADSMTQAIGTVFNVRQTASATRVAVVEGKVFVKPIAQFQLDNGSNTSSNTATESDVQDRYFLSVGEQASVDNTGSVSVQSNQDIERITSWRARRLIFKSESLQHIVNEFNRYNHAKILLDDSVLNSIKFSGVFDANDPYSFVKFLELNGDVKIVRITNDQILLEKNN